MILNLFNDLKYKIKIIKIEYQNIYIYCFTSFRFCYWLIAQKRNSFFFSTKRNSFITYKIDVYIHINWVTWNMFRIGLRVPYVNRITLICRRPVDLPTCVQNFRRTHLITLIAWTSYTHHKDLHLSTHSHTHTHRFPFCFFLNLMFQIIILSNKKYNYTEKKVYN